MKKVYLSTLILSLYVLTIFSCSKSNEEIDQSASQSDFYESLQGQDYLDYYSTPSIFFNVARVDEEAQTVSGWFVVREGAIYKYETTVEKYSAIDPVIMISRLERLKDIGQATNRSIDLVELVKYYKKTRNAADGDFKFEDTETTPSTSIFFNAYDLQLGNGNCLYCPVSQVSRDENAQLVLKTIGRTVTGAINVPTAREIVQWMNEIDESL